MYGRAGFALLRHRILLGLRNVTTGNETEPLFLQSPILLRTCMRKSHAVAAIAEVMAKSADTLT